MDLVHQEPLSLAYLQSMYPTQENRERRGLWTFNNPERQISELFVSGAGCLRKLQAEPNSCLSRDSDGGVCVTAKLENQTAAAQESH